MAKNKKTLSQKADNLIQRLLSVRLASEDLIKPLLPEDLCLQGMADASPPKWHLAHTTWFFEILVLKPYLDGYSGADSKWNFLFNSYYNSFGDRHPRSKRGLLTRPPIEQIITWRKNVNVELERLINGSINKQNEVLNLIELGIQHEQQHQELLLMDILDGFSRQPVEPAYKKDFYKSKLNLSQKQEEKNIWIDFEGGLVEIGCNQNSKITSQNTFHFDNEAPRHKLWLQPFQLASKLISNREYKEFIADSGYKRPELWMSEGWSIKEELGWEAPQYWRRDDSKEKWEYEFTLEGRKFLNPLQPVRHISWFEADAYARWRQARLPTEAEWEIAAQNISIELQQLHGELWQWTSSPYSSYPGFIYSKGALGEYNGKFMSSQFVLRGSSFLTPNGHERNTYRNFFPPGSRWMASGIRLAQ